MHESSRHSRMQCTRAPHHGLSATRGLPRRADPRCRHNHASTASITRRSRRAWHGRAAIIVGELVITGAAFTVAYVGLHSAPHEPAGISSITGESGATVTTAASTVPASRLRAGMVVDLHGRRWTVVRANRVSTRPGILLELREAGTPGFHILYVDEASSVTVVGRA